MRNGRGKEVVRFMKEGNKETKEVKKEGDKGVKEMKEGRRKEIKKKGKEEEGSEREFCFLNKHAEIVLM